jgi:hypothetical protein
MSVNSITITDQRGMVFASTEGYESLNFLFKAHSFDHAFKAKPVPYMADHGGYNMYTYVLAIL